MSRPSLPRKTSPAATAVPGDERDLADPHEPDVVGDGLRWRREANPMA
jgi:hypothetical protein